MAKLLLLLVIAATISPNTARCFETIPLRGSLDKLALDKLANALNNRSDLAQTAASDFLRQITPGDAALLSKALISQRGDESVRYKRLLRQFGAVVPDDLGMFRQSSTVDVDWLTAMVQTNISGFSTEDRTALVRLRYVVVLMRALAKTKTVEAANTLLQFAFSHRGAFRDECGRLIRSMGDAAVPALVLAPVMNDPLRYKILRYAAYQLDRMNRHRPSLAIASAPTEILTELLQAYGTIAEPAAIEPILKTLTHPLATIRLKAAWALTQYGGAENVEIEKRKLKFAGGRESDLETALFLPPKALAHHAAARYIVQQLPDNARTYAQLVRQDAASVIAQAIEVAKRQVDQTHRRQIDSIAAAIKRQDWSVAGPLMTQLLADHPSADIQKTLATWTPHYVAWLQSEGRPYDAAIAHTRTLISSADGLAHGHFSTDQKLSSLISQADQRSLIKPWARATTVGLLSIGLAGFGLLWYRSRRVYRI